MQGLITLSWYYFVYFHSIFFLYINLHPTPLDPYLRSRFNAVTGADYLTPFMPKVPMESGGVIQVLESSNHELYPVHSYLESQMFVPWRSDEFLLSFSDLKRLGFSKVSPELLNNIN